MALRRLYGSANGTGGVGMGVNGGLSALLEIKATDIRTHIYILTNIVYQRK